jgi:hypothetical protein
MTTTTRRHLTRAARLGTALVFGGSLALSAFVPVKAAGNAGPATAGWGYCSSSTTILVSVPSIEPARQLYGSTSLFGTPSQWVAFRANLARWNGTAWVAERYGTWYVGKANTSSAYGLSQTTWTDLSGRPIPSAIGFDNLAAGTWQAPTYYKVWYDFYWYADEFRPDGSASAWADGHREDRGAASGTAILDQTAYAWCKYPGPNWLLSVR